MRSTGKKTVEKERMGFAAHGWVVKRRQGVQWTDGVGKQFKSWKRGKTFHHDLWSPTDRKSTKRGKEKKIQSTFLSDWISEDPHQSRKSWFGTLYESNFIEKLPFHHSIESNWIVSSIFPNVIEALFIFGFTRLLMYFQRLSDGTKRTREH